ncbi:acyl-CoA dehydrogenase family protein [Oceanibaculum pacificum]|uniref:Acyl-CoA dehydrogenase n=1 Tax=Oceanibaculum pacificum TaxID=580166 RepID=A0A154W686_9PROT|nr:acyl-CoA dehydrogenase family protein [Oceanibaculum pacificum]KZD08973.1 hypothetical protein AUP43_08140 [Oceanibaculum pacificum]
MTEQTETIALLRNSAAGFAKFDGKRIRGWRGNAPGFDRDLWGRMAAQGWFSILAAEEEGGLGLGVEAAAAVAEQLGRACAPEPFVASGVLGPALLSQATNQALKQDLMPAVLSGDLLVSLAWQPAGGALPPESTGVTAQRRNGGLVLDGDARFINPAQADGYMVLAREPGGLLLVWVDAKAFDGALSEEPGPDGIPSGRLRLSGIELADSAVLMSGNRVAEAVQGALDQAVIVQSAELCGLMQRALDMTLDYLKTRQQFGVAIGSFQALQHRSVDLFIQQELARHATAAAIQKAEAGAAGRDLSLAASSAKARAAEAAMTIGTQAIQLHGAIGFTDEYDLGLYVNRIVRLAASLGNAAWHRRRFGDLSEGA